MTCEMCRYSLPKDYTWRVQCLGCRNLHTLCVDCGCRHSRRTGLQRNAWFQGDTWGELDACPDEVMVAAAVAGEIGESAEEAVWRVMRMISGEPNDAQTHHKLVRLACEAGLPAAEASINPASPNKVGLRLDDDREVWG